MNTDRYDEITEQIRALLALPMPPPAEKHLLRAQIFALKYEQLGLAGDLTEPEQDQRAREFTLGHLPERVLSYPIHLRETPMAGPLPPLKDYSAYRTRPPTSPETIQRNREALLAHWVTSPDTQQAQK
jgi:hypothetical protein